MHTFHIFRQRQADKIENCSQTTGCTIIQRFRKVSEGNQELHTLVYNNYLMKPHGNDMDKEY